MKVVTFIGDGDICYLVCIIIWAYGHKTKHSTSLYQSMLLSFVLCFGAVFNYILKSAFHKSRPLFDDINLADTSVKDCAAEFGNPSGHSLFSTSVYICVT
jgi:hypothetical protein